MMTAISGKRKGRSTYKWGTQSLLVTAPKGWPSGTSYSEDRVSTLTWDSQRDGQETASDLSRLGQGSLDATSLRGWVTFPGLLLTEAALVTICKHLLPGSGAAQGPTFSKGSHRPPIASTVPQAAINISISRYMADAWVPTLSEQACEAGSVQTGLGNLMEGYY